MTCSKLRTVGIIAFVLFVGCFVASLSFYYLPGMPAQRLKSSPSLVSAQRTLLVSAQRTLPMISVSPGWMVAEASLLLRCNLATLVLYSAAML